LVPVFSIRISSSSSQLEGVKIHFTKFEEWDRINFQEELKTWRRDCTTRSRVAIGARAADAPRAHRSEMCGLTLARMVRSVDNIGLRSKSAEPSTKIQMAS
jgi:hypothetical protein